MMLKFWARLYSHPTVHEVLLEREICKLGRRYRSQHPFFGLKHIADFVLIDDMVVIEVDGASHLTLAQQRKDCIHTLALEKLGYSVVRVLNTEVATDPAWALQTAFARISARPSISELECRLTDLPEPAKSANKTNRRR